MIRIIDRYILKELAFPFIQSLFVLTFILLLNQVMRTAELIINKGLGLGGVTRFLLLIIPPFLVFTLPIAVLICTVTTFARLSEDNEITVIKSVGIPLRRIMLPVILFSMLISLLTFWISVNVTPWSGRAIKAIGMDILKKEKSLLFLNAETFNMLGKNMVLYIEKMPTYSDMEGIFMSDNRDPKHIRIITAKRGTIINDPEGETVGFSLENGSIYTSSSGSKTDRIFFLNYDFKIRIDDIFSRKKTVPSITLKEIKKRLLKPDQDRSKLLRGMQNHYKNLAYPFSALLFGILGVPLGIANKRAGKSGGFAIGVGLIVVFYLFNTIADNLVSREILAPVAGAFFPIAMLAAVAFFLLKREG